MANDYIEPNEIEVVFTGRGYQFGYLDGILHGITHPERRICPSYWGPVLGEDEDDDEISRDFHSFLAAKDTRIAELEAENAKLREGAPTWEERPDTAGVWLYFMSEVYGGVTTRIQDVADIDRAVRATSGGRGGTWFGPIPEQSTLGEDVPK